MNFGCIFVDNVIFFNLGFIWLGNNDGFFFIGDVENEEFNKEVNCFINYVIVFEVRKVGLDCFEGIGNYLKWNKIIERIF